MFLEELTFILKRRRTLVSFAVLAAIPILVGTVLATLGGPKQGNGPAFINEVTNNGVFLGVTSISTSQLVVIPLVIAIVAGESLSAEASYGTLRYLLLSPISRTRLLVVKSFAVLCYAVIACLFMVFVGVVFGAILFPVGNVITLSGTSVPLLDGILRVIGMGLLAAISTFSIVAIGIFASTLTDSAIGAAAITFGATVVIVILNNIPELVQVAPLMFSNYWASGADLFRSPITYHFIIKNLIEQLGWMTIFFLGAWARFSTKDISS